MESLKLENNIVDVTQLIIQNTDLFAICASLSDNPLNRDNRERIGSVMTKQNVNFKQKIFGKK